jgi:hypothetical protein
MRWKGNGSQAPAKRLPKQKEILVYKDVIMRRPGVDLALTWIKIETLSKLILGIATTVCTAIERLHV